MYSKLAEFPAHQQIEQQSHQLVQQEQQEDLSPYQFHKIFAEFQQDQELKVRFEF